MLSEWKVAEGFSQNFQGVITSNKGSKVAETAQIWEVGMVVVVWGRAAVL